MEAKKNQVNPMVAAKFEIAKINKVCKTLSH